MKGFKATDKDMKCKGFQYKLNKNYKEKEAILCEKGFHFCENPFDVLNYYNIIDGRFFEIEAKSVSKETKNDDTKRVSKEIKLVAELDLKGFIKVGFNYLWDENNKSNNNNIVDSGDSSQVATSGDSSKVVTSGYSSKVATSGRSSKVATSGDYSQVATSGRSSQVATSGRCSQVATSGDSSQVATSGRSSQVATSGYCSQVATSGDSSKVVTSGYSSQVATSGDCSKVATSGDCSKVAVDGLYSVGANIGIDGVAKGKKGNWITLAEWKYNEKNYIPLCVKSVQIDGKKIKEDTWYKLKNSEFVEVGKGK